MMRRRYLFLFFWLLTTVGFIWLIYQGNLSFDSPSTIYVLIALLLCTITLWIWLPNPIKDIPSEPILTRRSWFILLSIIVVVGLFLARTMVGPALLYAWPVIAIVVLVLLKPKIRKQEVIYATVLAVVAGVAGLGAEWVSFHPIVWAILQVCLVFSGLIAGWALLRHTGLWQARIGHSQFLDNGAFPALQGFIGGIILSIPWALGIVLLGGAESQQWVQSWWQPFMAISAGIGEEVWGRVFPIPLLFLLLVRIFRPQRAYLLALIIISYWFAYLHTPGGVEGVVSTVMIGTLYSLPLAFICMHRDLETAIGFHFFVDFVKFLAVLCMSAGL